MELYIKNMVCPRCIMAVRTILQSQNIGVVHIQLGKVTTSEEISDAGLSSLKTQLNAMGFELLDSVQKKIVEQIKNIIIESIYNPNGYSVNYSTLLTDKINRDYSFLSKLFSSTEGITIEQYTILQKIERIKELLSYNQMTLSEIAYIMGYSSVAHISAQFKKVTGMTPSQFKEQGIEHRKTIDNM